MSNHQRGIIVGLIQVVACLAAGLFMSLFAGNPIELVIAATLGLIIGIVGTWELAK